MTSPGILAVGGWILIGLSALFLILLPIFAIVAYKIINQNNRSIGQSMFERGVLVLICITMGGIVSAGVVLIILAFIAANKPPLLD
jgi:small-conductance mechanosensitive channel